MMTGDMKSELTIGGVKLTPPAAVLASGITADQVISALTITYLLILIGHQCYKWWRDMRQQSAGSSE